MDISDLGIAAYRWVSAAVTDTRYSVDGLIGTPIMRKVKEATSNQNWGVSTTLKNEIAQATFDYGQNFDDIMAIIWERIEASAWRVVFKTLTLLEHLLKCGSSRVVDECHLQMFRIRATKRFYCVDADGVDRGKGIRLLTKNICDLLENHSALRLSREEFAKSSSKFTSESAMDRVSFTGISSQTPRSVFHDAGDGNAAPGGNYNLGRLTDNKKAEIDGGENKKAGYESFGRARRKKSQKRDSAKKKGRKESDILALNEGLDFGKPSARETQSKAEKDLIDLRLPASSQIIKYGDILSFEDGGFGGINAEVKAENNLLESFDRLNFDASADSVRHDSGGASAPSSLFERWGYKAPADLRDGDALSNNRRGGPASSAKTRPDDGASLASAASIKGGPSTSSLAETKIKEMIPGSSLVDLERLTSSLTGDSSDRQKRGKVKMNRM